MNKIFLQVVSLDASINQATERGDEQAEERLYAEQNALIDKIDSLGLRDKFDAFIKSLC